MHKSALSLQAKFHAILSERLKDHNQPISAFCKAHGITPWTFYYWKKKLAGKSARSAMRKCFIPLSLKPDDKDTSSRYHEIEFRGGAVLRIPGDLDRDTLAFLIGVLGRQAS